MTVLSSHLAGPGGEVARHLAEGRLQTAEEMCLRSLAAMADALNLKVMKVDSQPVDFRAFRERFGNEADTTDLSKWHTLEQARPSMFSSLFSLWLGRVRETESTDLGWIQETGRM